MIKIHQKYFVESTYDQVKPEKSRQNNQHFKNVNNIENKQTRFQIYPETKLACINNSPVYKTEHSEILVKYEKGFDMNTENLIIIPDLTHHVSKNDENSYIPGTFIKIQEELVENLDHKTEAVHAYKNYQ